MIPNCLACAHAHPVVENGRIDFSRKLCRESPPVPLALPGPNNTLQIIPCYPVVTKESPTCSRHDSRLPGEVVAEPKDN